MAFTKEEVFVVIRDRIKETAKGFSASVPTQEILNYAFGSSFEQDDKFVDLLQVLDTTTESLYAEYEIWRKAEVDGEVRDTRPLCAVTKDALKNCHGRWTETLFDRIVWDTLQEINTNIQGESYFVYVKLPERKNPTNENPKNKKAKVWTSLLGKKQLENIERRKKSLQRNDVKLESSNPDAVIIRIKKERCHSDWNPVEPYSEVQGKIDSIFKSCKGMIDAADQLVAFLSVKASTRSDRRYQFIVEGNSTKGLCAAAFDSPDCDLKIGALMRNKYYAFSFEKAKKADHDVLDGLIMFASLFNEAAVGYAKAIDEFNNCETPKAVVEVIKRICSNYQA